MSVDVPQLAQSWLRELIVDIFQSLAVRGSQKVALPRNSIGRLSREGQAKLVTRDPEFNCSRRVTFFPNLPSKRLLFIRSFLHIVFLRLSFRIQCIFANLRLLSTKL